MTIKLKAQKREILGKKTKKIRKDGLIPAVIYGHEFKNIPLQIAKSDFLKVLSEAGESTIINLDIEGEKTHQALIHGLERAPVSDEILHVDFYQITADEAMTIDVPLIFEGISPLVKDLGGTLVTNLKTIKVKALPKDLPHDIKLDISVLQNFGDKIKASDLPRLTGVEYLVHADETIALVEEPRSEEELKALSEEVKEDVEKVEGVVKEEAPAEGEPGKQPEKKEEQKS